MNFPKRLQSLLWTSAAAIGLCLQQAAAQLVIGTANTPVTVTFDESIGYNDGDPANDVFRYTENTPPALSIALSEPDAWEYSQWNGGAAPNLSTMAWSLAHTNFNWSGAGNGVPTAFGPDANGNAATSDRTDAYHFRLANGGSTISDPGYEPVSYTALSSLGLVYKSNEWANRSVTLRLRNATGAAVSSWDLGFAAWAFGTSTSTFSVQVSTDNVTYTPVLMQAIAPGSDDLTTLGTLSASGFSATVADGAYLYVRYDLQNSGAGAGIVIDNLAFTAVTGGGGGPAIPALSIVQSGASLVITCTSEAGFTYHLQKSSDLDAIDPWGTIETKPGTGDILEFSVDAPTASDKAFYQVVAE